MIADKPPYHVPSMTEIAAVPWNGLSVASTFSGCGGSCLGYRMAGYKVLWANEFVPAAQATYRENHPDTFLDMRDIRQIHPEDILTQLGMQPGDLDLLDGSPPCASFSTAGKRSHGWGKTKAYSDTQQRTDDLFFEYARLLKGMQPRVFVAENVSGLVKGVAKGYFKLILQELKHCGYRVEARLLDAQWLGVPQMRQRIIFLGVRKDLVGITPAFPSPLAYRYSVRDAIAVACSTKSYAANSCIGPDMPAAAIQASGQYFVEEANGLNSHGMGRHRMLNVTDKPMPTIQAQRPVRIISAEKEKRKFTIGELKRICTFPEDFILTGSYSQQWERLGRAVPPIMMKHIAQAIYTGIFAQL